jgi:hypothetical protein
VTGIFKFIEGGSPTFIFDVREISTPHQMRNHNFKTASSVKNPSESLLDIALTTLNATIDPYTTIGTSWSA